MLAVNAEVDVALRRYYENSLRMELEGATLSLLEEVRSYAVEVIAALARANPATMQRWTSELQAAIDRRLRPQEREKNHE